MKQVKLVDASSVSSIEGKINAAIIELMNSGKAKEIYDIKITMNHNLIIGMILYESIDYD